LSFDKSLRVEVGRRIRTARMSKGITGQKLALMARISPAYLSEVERGLSEVSGEKLLRIATSLRVSVQALLEGSRGEGEPGEGVTIPPALDQAAERLNLSYKDTVHLLQGRHSLVARRSQGGEEEWKVGDWIEFYKKVKKYLED